MSRLFRVAAPALPIPGALALLLVVTFAGPPSVAARGERGLPGRVVRVIDADTLVLRLLLFDVRVRLSDVLSPKRRTCFASESQAIVNARLLGRVVEVVSPRGRIGSVPAVAVRLEGSDVARWMVQEGLGFARYELDGGEEAKALRLAEERARTAGAGMWGACYRPGDVRIEGLVRREGSVGLRALRERQLLRWRLERPANGRQFYLPRLHLLSSQAIELQTRLRPGFGRPLYWRSGPWRGRYREPLVLARGNGTWAWVWTDSAPAGDPPVEERPYGVYYAGRGDFRELNDLGVNLVVLPYYSDIRRDLDAAYARGIKLAVIGGDWLAGEGPASRVRPTVMARQIRTIRDHPALWGYYAIDEPARRGVRLEILQRLYRGIRRQDPAHPVMVVFDQPARFGTPANPYGKGVADVVAFDIYTVNTQGYQPWIPYFLPAARQVVETQTPGTPVWLVTQAFGAGRLVQPTGSQLLRQVREGVRHGQIDGTVAFLWDRTWQDRFPAFRGDLRSSLSLRRALPEARALLLNH